jgi:DNA segregation ATPase FtsK/SpoIIIE-like protein
MMMIIRSIPVKQISPKFLVQSQQLQQVQQQQQPTLHTAQPQKQIRPQFEQQEQEQQEQEEQEQQREQQPLGRKPGAPVMPVSREGPQPSRSRCEEALQRANDQTRFYKQQKAGTCSRVLIL